MEIGSILVRLGLDNSRFRRGLSESEQQGNKFAGGIKKLGGMIAGAFAIDAVLAFGKEITGLAAKTEGVKQAFDRLNMPGLMSRLKIATRGTTDELKLMQSAVNARNFKISLEQLPKLLDFATTRAMETGQSVDYLVESLVLGIGRKSPLILDNLGLNVAEVREEFAKTGDMAKAVGIIIDREMAANGRAADTAATKTQRFSATWLDLKTTLGTFFSSATTASTEFFTGLLDNINKVLSNENYTKLQRFAALFSPDAQKKIKADLAARNALEEANGKIIANQAVEIAKTMKLDKEKSDVLQLIKKQHEANLKLSSRPQAIINSKATIKAINDELAKRKEVAAKEAELAAEREEEAKKAREAAAKKAAEHAAELAAARAIYNSQNKSIESIKTILKYNNERLDQAQDDTIRAAISKENKELNWQLWLLGKTKQERQAIIDLNSQIAPIAGKDLSVGTTAGKFEGKKPEEIAFGSTSDLDAVVAKNWESIDEYSKQKDEIARISEEMASVLVNTAVNSFQLLADSIAGVSDMNAGQAVASLLTPIADMAISAGVIIMATGEAITALKASLIGFFGNSAILAGGALIAVGVAAKAGLKALASSSGGSSRAKATSVSGGSIVSDSQRSQKQQNVNVNVKGVISGRDIQLVNERQNRYNSKGF